jgi:hypothetical protein
VTAVNHFYIARDLYLQEMIFFTSYRASVVLGKKNGEAALLGHKIKHFQNIITLLRRDDIWKQFPNRSAVLKRL